MAQLEHSTVGAVLRKTAKQFPDRPALEYMGQVWSYRELDREVDRVARCLLGWGVKRGDHLGIWCEAEPNVVFVMYAAVRIGAVAALVNTSLPRGDMKGILERTDVKWFVIGDGCRELDYRDLCQGLAEELPSLEGIAYCGLSGKSGGFVPLDELTMASEEALAEAEKAVTPEDMAYVIFTSGTTSLPKAVMGTHFSRVNMSIQQVKDMKITQEDRFCCALPLFHCFGLSANMVTACMAGACLYLPLSRRTEDLLVAISKGRCTILSGVPSMFAALLRRDDFNKWDTSSVRTGIIGGSMYPLELFREIDERFENMTLTACFGQSEATCGIAATTVDDPAEIRPTSGRFFEHTEGKIIDIQSGQEVPAGKLGEICVRGYHVMEGYYKRPEETAKALEQDGWLHTGDMGYIDENGNLHVTGRLKEMIIRGGENISPAEIEDAVADREQIVMCKVVGVPDSFYGEEICMCLVLAEGAELTEEQLREYLKQRLAYFKVPKYILFMDGLPTTPTGKIRLEEVKKLAKQTLGL